MFPWMLRLISGAISLTVMGSSMGQVSTTNVRKLIKEPPGILVLEYHALASPAALAAHPQWANNPNVLPTKTFADQLDRLDQLGIHTLTLREFQQAISGANPIPPKSVLLTFDDGYEDFYEYAYPALKAHKMHAALFIVTSWTASETKPAMRYVSWPQAIEMDASGFVDIACHTHDMHGTRAGQPVIQTASQDALRQDLAFSRSQLESSLHHPVPVVAFPFGSHHADLLQASRAAGFTLGFGPATGVLATRSADRMALPRWFIGPWVSLNNLENRLRDLR